jgi:peptidoglycan L-alanyl-D-glutamate endopeptidase CwlK
MASREIEALRPEMQPLAQAFQGRCRDRDVSVLIYCTLRSAQEQARLWRNGRSRADIDATIRRLRFQAAAILDQRADSTEEGRLTAQMTFLYLPEFMWQEPGTERVGVGRTLVFQASLLEMAPPQYGPRVVTNALPCRSAHNFGLAFDAVPLDAGKPVWDAESDLVRQMGECGEEVGLEWAGRWTRFTESVHFQTAGWRTATSQTPPQTPPQTSADPACEGARAA